MRRHDRGSITVEALLLVPALFAFTSLIVYVGRMTEAAITVRHAADAAARVASQASSQTANYRAIQTARHEMSLLKTGCDDSDVHVRRVSKNSESSFIVSVNCTVNSRGLGLLSLLPVTVGAESSEVVDVYTAR